MFGPNWSQTVCIFFRMDQSGWPHKDPYIPVKLATFRQNAEKVELSAEFSLKSQQSVVKDIDLLVDASILDPDCQQLLDKSSSRFRVTIKSHIESIRSNNVFHLPTKTFTFREPTKSFVFNRFFDTRFTDQYRDKHLWLTIIVTCYRPESLILRDPKWKQLFESLNSEQDNSSDVDLIVNGRRFKAHKEVLTSSSDYFQRMFAVDMLENRFSRVDIPDVDGNVFADILKFIYTGQVMVQKGQDKDGDQEKIVDLLILADRFGIMDLMHDCEQRLIAMISKNNYPDLLFLAVNRCGNAFELKRSVIEFISANKDALI